MKQNTTPARVLVIDDDEMSRELLVLLLEREGYEADYAESGHAALAMLRQGSTPDLILTDLQMPGLTEGALAAKLREASGPSTLVYAISGSQPAPHSISAFDGFLLKPFKVDEVHEALESRAHQRSPKRPTVLSITNGRERPSDEHSTDPESSAAPVLNETIYGQLARSMPVPQLHEMYSLCVNDTRQRIAKMYTLAESGDPAQFVREAHAIKGSCGMLGATQLHQMAAQLEQSGPSAGVNSLDELSAACDRLERMLGSRV